MVSISYPVIYFTIKTIFTEENRIKRLETQVCLLDNPYKIGVILAVRIYNNKAIVTMWSGTARFRNPYIKWREVIAGIVTRNGLSYQVTWQVMWPPHGHRHTATATRPPPHGHRHTATTTRPPPHGHRHTATATRLPPHGLATLGRVTCQVMCRVMWWVMCQVVTAPLTMGTY